nr:hypothetical protein [Nitrosomonas nitrosa]
MGEGRGPDLSHCLAVAKQVGLRQRVVQAMAQEVDAAIARWPEFADEAGVPGRLASEVAERHRRLMVSPTAARGQSGTQGENQSPRG